MPRVGSIAWFSLCLGLVLLARCKKEPHARWIRELGGDIAPLAIVADGGERIWGVDTSTFELSAVLRGKGMAIRKVARTPEGGVLFTDEASPATPILRRVESSGRLGGATPLHPYAVAPFAHGSLVAVGSRRVEPDGLARIALFDANSLSPRGALRIHHGVRQMEDFYGAGDTVYIPCVVEPFRASYAYPILLNVHSLDTVHRTIGPYLLNDQSEVFSMASLGDTLYMATRTDQMLLSVHLPSRRVLVRRAMRHTLREQFGMQGGAVYYPHADQEALCMLYVWQGAGLRRVEWVRLDRATMRVLAVRRVLEDSAPWNDADDLCTYGRYYMLLQRDGSQRTLLFIDMQTGLEAGRTPLGN